MQRSWSSVSLYGNFPSNSFCQIVSGENAYPCTFSLLAYSSINSLATALKLFLTLVVVFSQSFVPNLFSFSPASSPPTYLRIESNAFVGIYKISSPAYLSFI